MTGPVTTEALVERMCETLLQVRYGSAAAVLCPFAEQDTLIQADIHGDVSALIAGPLAPLLAAHQQVTAERDEEKARADRIDAKLGELNAAVRECLPPVDTLIAERQAAEASLATATSELARLRAEGEALRATLKPFAEAADAYSHSHDESQINERPAWAGKDYVEVRLLAKHLRAARAATAREGQADA